MPTTQDTQGENVRERKTDAHSAFAMFLPIGGTAKRQFRLLGGFVCIRHNSVAGHTAIRRYYLQALINQQQPPDHATYAQSVTAQETFFAFTQMLNDEASGPDFMHCDT